ncbi:MAG: M48 family metallopeptidase [Bacteroidetes bacterium]|nr:M48 family metallopeptidase [Bacteroidota bacterium]
MKYVGLQSQIWKNNTRSLILLVMFPVVFYVLAWLFLFFTADPEFKDPAVVSGHFLRLVPWITIGVGLWFLIAWFSHSAMINAATGSRPLERKENKRVYNLVENLAITAGMKMPKVNVIEDDSLNAFASGIGSSTFTISLSRGIVDKLNDEELEGVIAHELTHIRNRDVRLLIISVIFVGIFAFIAEAMLRSLRYGSLGRSSGGKKGSGGAGILIALALALVGYLLASLFRFAISRKREYMADAGAAYLTKKPVALASALRKVSRDPVIEAVKRRDVAQMFIENPQLEDKKKGSFFASMFATHPSIKSRIEILEQF